MKLKWLRDARGLAPRTLMMTAICLGMAAGDVEACSVCIPTPETTAADLLIDAGVVVLARENPEKPFSFLAIEVLAGALEAPEIDLFLDSRTRRRLVASPERSVVLLRDQDTAGTWRSLGFATGPYEALIRQILIRAPSWSSVGGEATFDPLGAARAEKGGRVDFFMPHLSDPDRSTRLLAYLEVGRATYDRIRYADRFVPASEVRAFLADRTFIEWHPLYILLMGVNATESEKTEIRSTMHLRLRSRNTLNLGAWATAFVEIDGEAAIEWLNANYLGHSGWETIAITEILNALSVHGNNGRSELRTRIAESYALALETHPAAAASAVRDLIAWQDMRSTGLARSVLSQGLPLDPPTEFALGIYAAMHDG